MFLQRALNVLNSKGKLYPDLEVDGAIGLVTVSALRGYLTERDEDTLVKALNCLQGAYYVNLAERREKDETFVYGWFKNRVKL
jgi:Putative secretion activating protein